MHHNILKYWQHLQNLPAGHRDKPSPRTCRLMIDMFEAWRTQKPFPPIGALGHLRDHLDEDEADIMTAPLILRRGYAMNKTLKAISGPDARSDGLFKVHPDEIILGSMPPYSVGQGKEMMDYLKGAQDDWDERLEFEAGFLNPWSNFGHICPNYQRAVDQGLHAMIDECRDRAAGAGEDRQAFYTAVIIALQGVIDYATSFADRADDVADANRALLQDHPDHPSRDLIEQRIAGMQEAAERLRRIPGEPCQSLKDAAQCVFILNCALHWTGELTSIGRLDQIFQPFFEKDGLSFDEGQEIIDCLWVKFDEQVLLDNRMIVDHFTSADGALLGAGGASNFDQGALTNQWMQQVTIGGVIANNDDVARDACNDITRMCLNAARKLPFNCPTVDLRVHKDTPADILDLAAEAMLSGGAHPILMNDDKLVPALKACGDVELRSARNYACDGCYETIFPGETEFSFIYVPGVDVLEKALNSGAGFGAAGGTYLRGMKSSYRTAEAAHIPDYDTFYRILEDHIWLNVNRQLSGLFHAYGSKGRVCPTPILSALIDGCIESGRDMYDGGARYHMFAPLMTGISTVADSLYVVDHLVFREGKFSLDELVACLRSDWGSRSEVIGRKVSAERAREIRQMCLEQPRFGCGDDSVDTYAWRLADSFASAIERALDHPMHAAARQSLEDRFASADKPFNMVITPGVGTFEQYNFGGGFAGATPDGRGAGMPLASDLAASPIPQDLDPTTEDGIWADASGAVNMEHKRRSLGQSLASWNNPAFERFADGAPSDFNIPEDFPKDALVDVLKAFADGHGSNIMTVTTASADTMQKASEAPLDYDLLRVRMGGWTEFFSVLFDAHKKQHIRRPMYHP